MDTAIQGTDEADAYALLADGRCVHVRTVTPRDWQMVHDVVDTMGARSLYRRFFRIPSHAGEMLANSLCAPPAASAGGECAQPAHGALIALLEERAVGIAEWHRTDTPHEAEVAFEVADSMHGRGIATLLAEHLMLAARRAGIRRLTAVTLGENGEMLGVFLALGIPVERTWDDGDWVLTIPLDRTRVYGPDALEAIARREAVADEASLRGLFEPNSIAIFGAEGDPAAQAVITNLAGFDGPVHQAGVRGERLPADARPDLAVITSPAADAVVAARCCAEHHVLALVVTAADLPTPLGRELLGVCRARGMRLVGPGSLGVAVPGGPRGFNALIAGSAVGKGPAGVAVQSGGVGLALLAHLRRLGIGTGSFAAVGAKYDVSANDLLMHWEYTEGIRFGLLHVESFGNPRKFARTARRVSRRIPLFAVDPEQSPSQARTALYEQAGIIALPSLGALIDAAALAAHQPLPSGPRVAVLANTHGMSVLAAQACTQAGLEVAGLIDLTPAAATADLTTAITGMLDARDAGAPHSLLIALAPVAGTRIDVTVAVRAAAGVPVAAALADQAESVTVLTTEQHEGDGDQPQYASFPSYADAADAAQAIAALVRATHVRRAPMRAEVDLPSGIDVQALEALTGRLAASAPGGRVLEAEECAELLAALGFTCQAPEVLGALQHTITFTGWQDAVFGPLVSVAGDIDREPRTLLAPFGRREADASIQAVATNPRPASLVDAALRLSAAMDACPQLASFHLTLGWNGPEQTATVSATGATGPGCEQNPYLRKLRRAPME